MPFTISGNVLSCIKQLKNFDMSSLLYSVRTIMMTLIYIIDAKSILMISKSNLLNGNTCKKISFKSKFY